MQNKKNLVFKIFAFVLAVFSFCCLNCFSSNSVVLAEETSDGFVEISSLEGITDMSGKYRLAQKDGAYTYTNNLGNFNGILDGNGCVISYSNQANNFTSTQPLFDSLESNAVVFNLSFAPTESENQIVYFGASAAENQKTSYGLLANKINGAQVYGIEFKNTQSYIYDNDTLTSVPELNVGFLAGQITGGNINQIKVTNCSILPYTKDAVASEIRSNFNIGFIAGKISYGTKLQNNYISKPVVNLTVANSSTTSHNFGMLVGLVESGYITNNILVCNSETEFVSFTMNALIRYINFGYVVGRTFGTDISLFNNVLNLNKDTMLTLQDENVCAGLLIGNMSNALSSEDLQGFATNYAGKYVGNYANQTITNDYSNISKIDLEASFLTKIKDIESWNNIYVWDFDKVWETTPTSHLPILQFFEKYAITFNPVVKIKDLADEKVPTSESIVNSEFSIIDYDVNQPDSTLNVPYGKSVKLTTSVKDTKNYNKFFKISALLLNGEEIFRYDYDTQTSTTKEGYKVTGQPNQDTGAFEFEIADFVSKNAGTYSVQLLRNVFKLKINVLELEVDGNTILPGKVKSNMATDGSSEIMVDMLYGNTYTYELYDVNSDYSKEADWYLFNQNPNNAEFVFELDGRSTSFVAKNKLEWVFDENCVLFGTGSAEDTNDYLILNNYYYDKDNPEDEKTNIFATTVVFSKDVKDIEIRFKYDDEEEILEKIADVVIDDGAVSLVYVEEDGYYKAKIRFSNKTHVISLKGLSTDYTFDGWYLNSRMPQAINDTLGGTFEIINDGDASTVVIYAVFTKENAITGANLLWLWLTLAGVGLLLIVVIIVVVVKKKKAGTSSYKKYMY